MIDEYKKVVDTMSLTLDDYMMQSVCLETLGEQSDEEVSSTPKSDDVLPSKIRPRGECECDLDTPVSPIVDVNGVWCGIEWVKTT